MTTTAERVLQEAMALSAEEKAQIAAELLRSLDPQPEIETAWAEEAERRLDDHQAGRSKSVPLDEAVDETRAWLKERRK